MHHRLANMPSQTSTTNWATLPFLIFVAGCGGSSAKQDGGGSATVDGGTDAATDVAAPAPATTIPTAALSFGMVACGTAGGSLTLSFTNTGVGTLHYRASIAPGGMLYSLQGAMADGSLSGDVAPEASATLTVVAGTVPTMAGSGASFPGSLAITTNAAGAETSAAIARGTCASARHQCTPTAARQHVTHRGTSCGGRSAPTCASPAALTARRASRTARTR